MTSYSLRRTLDALQVAARQHASNVDAVRPRWSDRRAERFQHEYVTPLIEATRIYDSELETLEAEVSRHLRNLGD